MVSVFPVVGWNIILRLHFWQLTITSVCVRPSHAPNLRLHNGQYIFLGSYSLMVAPLIHEKSTNISVSASLGGYEKKITSASLWVVFHDNHIIFSRDMWDNFNFFQNICKMLSLRCQMYCHRPSRLLPHSIPFHQLPLV